MPAKRDWFLAFSRYFVGGLFTISGLIKVNDIRGFGYKLEEYFEVFQKHSGLPFHEMFAPWSVGLAGLIALVETALAFFLILGYWRRLTAWALLLMIVFFTFLTGYSAITKAVSDCGCFGDVIKFTPWQSFGKDILLLAFIGYIFLKREELRSLIRPPLHRYTAWGLTAFVAALTGYLYAYLPVLDFLPYYEGRNLKKALESGPNGLPEITDYVPVSYSDCQVDELKGEVIVIVALRLETLSEKAIETLRQFMVGLPKGRFQVVGVTSSPSEVRRTWPQTKNLSICFAAQDQTVIKAMLRADLGVIYLRDGQIVSKWPWRRLSPSVAAQL
jgi:uncharacterized membrane protein YphA (DoxX/SURF4 family)